MANWVTQGWSCALRLGQQVKGAAGSGKRVIGTIDLVGKAMK